MQVLSALGSALLAVVLCATACGGDGDEGRDGTGEGGDGGASGAEAADAGQGGTGAPSSSTTGGKGNVSTGGRPAIPEPPDDSCSRFAFEYDASACVGGCVSARCDCDPFPVSVAACNMKAGGCVTAFNCKAACAADL